ncbi:MAG: motility protein A [Epsilonproteobacteria bacterium]|nr:motility protein A [Campylobacterota bacterium]NPA56505.1 motility protein A [Campylobacterota bacterium]
MEIGTLIGLIGAWVLIIVSIVLGGSIGAFINAPSMLIVIGGGFAAALASFPLKEFLNGVKAIGKVFKPSVPDPLEMINFLVEATKKARKEGILALEADIDRFYDQDKILGNIMRMLIDGQSMDEIEANFDSAIAQEDKKLSTEIAVWDALGELFPALGMIGTLIGLIQMLQNLSDPAALGPGMAVAMITTLYGAILANILCIPVSKKLKYYKDLILLYKEAYIITVKSIERGVNPNTLQQQLASLLGVEMGD